MDATTPLTPEAQRKQDRARKRKAILAGGVVLGLGAAVTLAAWSDDVFANGIFNTGSFELEGNVTAAGTVDNTTDDWFKFDGADAANTADLAFDQVIGNESTLSYNEPVFAPIALRLSDDTTVNATVQLANVTIVDQPATGNTLATKADYTVYSGVDAETCTNATPTTNTSSWAQAATATGAPAAGGSAGVIPNSTSSNPFGTPLDKATAAENDQTVLPLCIKVTLNNNTEAAMGIGATTVQWRFTATQTVS